MTTISIIAAMAQNNTIGSNNKLPWRLPNDLKHFKKITMGKPMLMGRKTWESLPGLLPGRKHIVLTRNKDFSAEGAEVVHSIEQLMKMVSDEKEIMIVGGGEIYRLMLKHTDQMYLTRVMADVSGDAHFPDWSMDDWTLISSECHQPDDKHAHGYCFEHYVKK